MGKQNGMFSSINEPFYLFCVCFGGVEVETVLVNNECKVVEKRGVRVNPFARRFSLAPSLQVNYMVTAART